MRCEDLVWEKNAVQVDIRQRKCVILPILMGCWQQRLLGPWEIPYSITLMNVEIVNHSHHALPDYATLLSAGMDLRANLDAPITLAPLERRLIPTGLRIALPAGYEAQVRPRSGMALKHGIGVLNSPGTIDADYRGEIGVVLVNLSDEDFVVNPGERVAQMVIAQYEQAVLQTVDTLDETERGEGGYGHTGVK